MVRSTVFELSASRMDRTTGAADIDVSGPCSIIFDAEVQIYLDGESSKYMDIIAWYPIGIAHASSIHVNAAVGYAVM